MADRNIEHLDTILKAWYLRLCSDLKTEGIDARLIEGWRDPAYQQSLVDKHITTVCPAHDFHCATANGSPASKAFDLGIFDKNGDYITDGKHPSYTRAGLLWEQYAATKGAPAGMIWGGRFVHPKPDPDHFQIN